MSLGACHALELAFVFVFDTLGVSATMAGESAPAHLADQMHQAWVAFGRDGTPGWRQWTPKDRAVMTFDVTSELTRGPRGDELALWDGSPAPPGASLIPV
jgi:para-nitrobenzyl esterase